MGDAAGELVQQGLTEGTLPQRKEFLRGFVHEIAIDPDAARGTHLLRAAGNVFDDGARGWESNPHDPKGQGILRLRERGSEQRT